ncbi:hypothetical protein ACOMHN_014125 [Nucella lapillus]
MQKRRKCPKPSDPNAVIRYGTVGSGSTASLLRKLAELFQRMRVVASQRKNIRLKSFVQIGFYNTNNGSGEVVSVLVADKSAISFLISQVSNTVELLVSSLDATLDQTTVQRLLVGYAEEMCSMMPLLLFPATIVVEDCAVVQIGLKNEIMISRAFEYEDLSMGGSDIALRKELPMGGFDIALRKELSMGGSDIVSRKELSMGGSDIVLWKELSTGGSDIVSRKELSMGGSDIVSRKELSMGGSDIVSRKELSMGGSDIVLWKELSMGGSDIVSRKELSMGGSDIVVRKELSMGGSDIVSRKELSMGGSDIVLWKKLSMGGSDIALRKELSMGGSDIALRKELSTGGSDIVSRKELPMGGSDIVLRKELSMGGSDIVLRKELSTDGSDILLLKELSMDGSDIALRKELSTGGSDIVLRKELSMDGFDIALLKELSTDGFDSLIWNDESSWRISEVASLGLQSSLAPLEVRIFEEDSTFQRSALALARDDSFRSEIFDWMTGDPSSETSLEADGILDMEDMIGLGQRIGPSDEEVGDYRPPVNVADGLEKARDSIRTCYRNFLEGLRNKSAATTEVRVRNCREVLQIGSENHLTIT